MLCYIDYASAHARSIWAKYEYTWIAANNSRCHTGCCLKPVRLESVSSSSNLSDFVIIQNGFASLPSRVAANGNTNRAADALHFKLTESVLTPYSGYCLLRPAATQYQ